MIQRPDGLEIVLHSLFELFGHLRREFHTTESRAAAAAVVDMNNYNKKGLIKMMGVNREKKLINSRVRTITRSNDDEILSLISPRSTLSPDAER